MVGDVCCDCQCPLTELGGQLLQAFDATGQQCQPVAAGGEVRAVAEPIPDEAPVITATGPALCCSVSS
ncbi:MAG: hypothetical protein K0R13_1392 [Propionibacteriaceae bacterium]|jgi:hypothetical protein|nr:hypothetical protein [Propionibacteriaceae bacterium]